MEVRRTLQASSPSDQHNSDAINQLESSVKSYLMTTSDNFHLDDVEKTVVNQVRRKEILGIGFYDRARNTKYGKEVKFSIFSLILDLFYIT